LQMQTFALSKHFVRGFVHTGEYTLARAIDRSNRASRLCLLDRSSAIVVC
jgi:hypothetical protein